MSEWSTCALAVGESVTPTEPEVQIGQTLLSSSSGYFVLGFIGEGCFGKVAKCQNVKSKEIVAVKILKDSDVTQDTEKEVSILKAISVLKPDLTNVVKFFEQFKHMGQTCLAFEMLDITLYDFFETIHWMPMSLNSIRAITKQLLVALDALKRLKILHTDIKPDNIMFVNVQNQPLRVKLIDFGLAIPASEVFTGMEIQPGGFRAPEVTLGLPFTEAIDVWGLGCIMSFLYLAENLFPVNCDYQMMKGMVEILGQPDDHLLRAGFYTDYFFTEEVTADGSCWRLMTPDEYTASNNLKPKEWNSFIDLQSSLDGLLNVYPKWEAAEYADRRTFVDLLKRMLHLHGDERISPHEALQHPFITMSHLTKQPFNRNYLTISQAIMRVCPVEYREKTSVAYLSHQQSATGCYDTPATGSLKGTKTIDDGSTCNSDKGILPLKESFKDFREDALVPGTSDEKLLSTSHDVHPAALFPNGLHVRFNEEDPATWFFDGPQPCFNDETVRPFDAKGLTASAPRSRSKRLMKRSQRFFSGIRATFCCCWRP